MSRIVMLICSCALLCAFLAAVPTTVAASTASGTGTLELTVLDPGFDPGAVDLTFLNTTTRTKTSATVVGAGTFSFDLEPGMYFISARNLDRNIFGGTSASVSSGATSMATLQLVFFPPSPVPPVPPIGF